MQPDPASLLSLTADQPLDKVKALANHVENGRPSGRCNRLRSLRGCSLDQKGTRSRREHDLGSL